MQGPVLLCGLGRVGWGILDCLRSAGFSVVALDTCADAADPRLRGVRLVRGDCRVEAELIAAGVREAGGVIIATSDDLLNISCALMVRRLVPGVRIVLRMFNQNLVTRLGKAVPNVTALSVSALSAPLLALTAITGEVLAAFPVADQPHQVVEISVPADSPLVGRPLGELDEGLRYLLMAHSRAGGRTWVLHDIDPAVSIAVGDRLVVGGRPADLRRLLHPGRDHSSDVLWAGKLRRWWRVARRTLAQVDTPVKICAVALLLVVAGSAATYHYGLGHPWYDGLYRTISVIFTGSDMGGTDYDGWAKVFVSLLKMFGTVAVAAFTAIFTNYLIRARLGGIFEVRRIPDSGHVLVVGLGNVGFRVVEELDRLGEQPVVIERKADNPFITTCRRKGVPVMVGDATVRETLIQARAKEARAVVACTSLDLVNLEVALLVAELNDKQRVVVRLADAVLADTARTAAGVRMAVSLPDLAAPAFVAGLLGDRVLSMFPVGGQMLAVVQLTVQADDTALGGRSIKALAIDYRFAPIAVTGPDNKVRDVDTAYHLASGDGLTAVALLPDLERVSRRIPIPTDRAVEVTAYPPWAREGLVLRARTLRRLELPDADGLVAEVPFIVANGLTRGEAEELVTILLRDKVTARVCPTTC